MNSVNLGIALDIAGPAIFMILIIVGAVKAWPYRKTDKDRFNAIYKPYKYWGFGIWIVFNVIGLVLVMNG